MAALPLVWGDLPVLEAGWRRVKSGWRGGPKTGTERRGALATSALGRKESVAGRTGLTGPDGGLGPPQSQFTRASFQESLEVGFDLKPGPRRPAAPQTAARVKDVRLARPMGGPATGLLPVFW